MGSIVENHGERRALLGLSTLVLPAIFLYHVGELDDIIALLVFLAGLVGLFVFPAKGCLAAITINIGHRVQAGQQHALLGLPAADVHHRVEQVSAPLRALKVVRMKVNSWSRCTQTLR